MHKHIEPVSRMICLALGVLLLLQLARVVTRPSPLRQLAIPALPTLSTNADADSLGKTTNAPSRPSSLSLPSHPEGQSLPKATNAPTGGVSIATGALSASNTPATPTTGGVAIATGTQSPSKATNAPTGGVAIATGALSASNTPTTPATGGVAVATGTQSASKATNAPTGGVAIATAPPGNPRAPGQMPGGPNRPGGPPGMRLPELPPAVQARVDRIVKSEIFGAIPKPPPIALLGIAGRDAFLRGPNGQTGIVKEGAELGGLKLLKIGTNRVLVEEDGQTKELTIFSGFGSETLLPKGKENPQ